MFVFIHVSVFKCCTLKKLLVVKDTQVFICELLAKKIIVIKNFLCLYLNVYYVFFMEMIICSENFKNQEKFFCIATNHKFLFV